MKNPATLVCMVLFLLWAVAANAQNNLPNTTTFFNNLPNTILCTQAQLSSMFVYDTGEQVSMHLSNSISLSGTIATNLIKYQNLQTVVIKLPAFGNSLFSLSKQNNKGIITFTGRIFNPASADGFELKQTADGNYKLDKIDLNKIITACNH